MPIATLNPATGETVRTFSALTSEELDDRLEKAKAEAPRAVTSLQARR